MVSGYGLAKLNNWRKLRHNFFYFSLYFAVGALANFISQRSDTCSVLQFSITQGMPWYFGGTLLGRGVMLMHFFEL